jgi:DeoR/GlpR family transcriptional regulator of sugar metabolism
MAMNASSLAAAIKSAVDAIDVDNGEITNNAAIDAIAQAIVNHIKDNAKTVVGSGSSAGQWPII